MPRSGSAWSSQTPPRTTSPKQTAKRTRRWRGGSITGTTLTSISTAPSSPRPATASAGCRGGGGPRPPAPPPSGGGGGPRGGGGGGGRPPPLARRPGGRGGGPPTGGAA